MNHHQVLLVDVPRISLAAQSALRPPYCHAHDLAVTIIPRFNNKTLARRACMSPSSGAVPYYQPRVKPRPSSTSLWASLLRRRPSARVDSSSPRSFAANPSTPSRRPLQAPPRDSAIRSDSSSQRARATAVGPSKHVPPSRGYLLFQVASRSGQRRSTHCICTASAKCAPNGELVVFNVSFHLFVYSWQKR
jgi:hypothetical protein